MEEVRKLLLGLMATAMIVACTPQGEHTDYALSWEGDGIGVTVRLISPRDTLVFSYASDDGGMTDQMTWLQDLTINRGQVAVDSATRQFTIRPDGGRAEFSYVVRCTLPEDYAPDGCLMDVFRPDIDGKMLYAKTRDLLVMPAEESDEEMPVSVTWESLPPYPVFCLYNAGQGTAKFEGKTSGIQKSVVVGDPLLTVDSVQIDGHLHYLVTALRKEADTNKVALKDYFRRLYTTLSHFWEEPYDSPFSMVVFPFRSNTFEVTGNGYPNGLVSRYDATADTILNLERRDLFTHEIGHKWLNNGTIWFAEGFNEMQTAYQLVVSGIAEPAYFADYFNNALSGLHHNPHRNVPDEQAEEHFWDDGDYIWLLYWRGFSYAFHLAGVYEKETGHPNAWKPMMQAVKPYLKDLTAEKILEAMATLMDKERLERDYRTYILEGRDFDFLPEDMPSGCTIVRKADGTPQLIITDTDAFAQHFK